MPPLDWEKFKSLPGDKSKNFENLCRALISLNFRRYGQFNAYKNQPGIEFHLKLLEDCSLGKSSQWYGWQCKFHELNSTGNLKAASRKDIEDSIKKTEKYLPELTDWILWTPYTLSKSDQDWFKSLKTKYKSHQWTEKDIDTYLNGPTLILRYTYFGDLVITPDDLERNHRESIQLIREAPVHQLVNAERIIRRMLGEPGSWGKMIDIGRRLKKTFELFSEFINEDPAHLEEVLRLFISTCNNFAETLLNFHEILAEGDLEVIQAKLGEREKLVNTQIFSTLRWLRIQNIPFSLEATNAISDMHIAQELLDEVEEFLGVGLVAVLADAGDGKTQISAQVTSPQKQRPGGILFYGRNLHRGQTLNDLAHYFSINGVPVKNIESLLAALDAAGKRSRCRLPIFIDGLNESENPKDWKELLLRLGETIKRYPNVLVICTLRTGEHRREDYPARIDQKIDARETFANWALPDNIKRIESEGFGRDTEDAIDKYFKYYKINSGDAEIPVDLLQHPLTLNIFCEVTNPKRESEVKIEYFPASLTSLLEKYVANACERISQMININHPYNIEELRLAIYKLGLELWESKKQEVCENNYKKSLSNAPFEWDHWDSNIINLFAQEGIVFRNPGKDPEEYLITPAYHALGGYIIANALLTKHKDDKKFEWLGKSDIIDSFIGENRHHLAFDIFKSLVALTPRYMQGKQLWMTSPDILRRPALRLTTEIEAEDLDKDTVCELVKLFKSNLDERINIFPRLQRTRGAVEHPLNAIFLDSILRELSVSDRDLSWTEWIRKSSVERLNDLLAIELKWKDDINHRTSSDQIKIKWVIWHLTSTNHELREIATRVLYWFGRGDPRILFKESINSLEINDPYIPERMLAASYGVAMAKICFIEDKNFIKKILPEFAKDLYKLFFAEDARYYNTHFLMRKYVTGIIEIASLHNPALFSKKEIQNSKPPFNHLRSLKWEEIAISKQEHHSVDSPFRMDFENYVLGSLVPNRGNYDFDQSDYKKIRAQVLWRIEQLGWTHELFKDIDQSIEREGHWPRTQSDKKKTDRYGKKYSWIAYLEMYGYLFDKGVFNEEWRVHEIPVDIDPSFPEIITEVRLLEDDFLGDSEIDTKDWISNESSPNLDSYFKLDIVQDIKGPWINLDGFFTQQDELRGRRIFCYIRSFFIDNTDITSFLKLLSCQELGGRWLPEKPEVSNTFVGEIPWSYNFPNNGLTEFSFAIREKIKKIKSTKKEIYLDGEKLKKSKMSWLLHYLSNKTARNVKKEKKLNDESVKRIEIRDVPFEYENVEREYQKFNTFTPVCDLRIIDNQNLGNVTILAKEIAVDLGLIGKPQTFNLFTRKGEVGTLYFSHQRDNYNNNQFFFFIREDLLKSYLKDNNFSLVWAIWGERGYSSEQINKLFIEKNRPEQPYKVFQEVKHFKD